MRWFVSYSSDIRNPYSKSIHSITDNCIVEWDGLDLNVLYDKVQSELPDDLVLREVVSISLIPYESSEFNILKCENEALKLMNAKLQELLLEHGITYENKT